MLLKRSTGVFRHLSVLQVTLIRLNKCLEECQQDESEATIYTGVLHITMNHVIYKAIGSDNCCAVYWHNAIFMKNNKHYVIFDTFPLFSKADNCMSTEMTEWYRTVKCSTMKLFLLLSNIAGVAVPCWLVWRASPQYPPTTFLSCTVKVHTYTPPTKMSFVFAYFWSQIYLGHG